MSAVVLRGDAAHLPLPDGSVDLIVTSPPYFGQRDYRDGGESLAGQIGSEETPAEYVAALLRCTREWVRVLKPGGSIFVNLGDKYSGYTNGQGKGRNIGGGARSIAMVPDGPVSAPTVYGVPNKSLMGLPARYMLGCIDDLGLILRRDNIWSKSSGMPESVTDRCATRHEYLFHFTKEPRYFSAVDEIREPHAAVSLARSRRQYNAGDKFSVGTPNTLNPEQFVHPLGRLPGSVWEIAVSPLVVPEDVAHSRCCGGRKQGDCEDGLDHHAPFPVELPRRAILGWSPSGICTECGDGRRPVVAVSETSWARRKAHGDPIKYGPGAVPRRRGRSFTDARDRAAGGLGAAADRAITGYACACPDAWAPTRPAVVLDPFGGTGTTALIADVLGRIGISVDRSAGYCDLAAWRTTDPGERARALGVPKPPPVPEGQRSLFDEEAS